MKGQKVDWNIGDITAKNFETQNEGAGEEWDQSSDNVKLPMASRRRSSGGSMEEFKREAQKQSQDDLSPWEAQARSIEDEMKTP